MFGQAACALIAIAMVHSDNRAAAAIAMGIFASGVAVCALLIASHDQPFTGEISVKPDVLLQVGPEWSDVGSPCKNRRLLSRRSAYWNGREAGLLLAFGPPHDSFPLWLQHLLVVNGYG